MRAIANRQAEAFALYPYGPPSHDPCHGSIKQFAVVTARPESPRRGSRIAVGRDCLLFDDHGERHPAHLLDVSRSGFRLRSAEPFEPGDLVRMAVDGHDFRCQIRWSKKGEIGGVFLDLAEVSAGFS